MHSLFRAFSRLWERMKLVFLATRLEKWAKSAGSSACTVICWLETSLFLVLKVRKPQLLWLPGPASMNFTRTLCKVTCSNLLNFETEFLPAISRDL